MSTFYKLAVKEIIRETPEAVSVLFQVPEELQANYRFVAGQYINLKLTLDGNEIRRAYSICATPESGELRITIKSIKNGYFSKFANEQLTIGKVLEVGTPEGKFTFEPDASRQKNYAAFVAGSGITPVMSILQTVLEEEPNSTFVLVYGNKSSNETIFYNQLHDLQLKYVGRFFVHYVFSQQKAEDQLFGRIEKSTVNFVLKNKHKEKEFDKFYLCGPEEMIFLLRDELQAAGLPKENIHYELFTSGMSEDDKKRISQILEKKVEGTEVTIIDGGKEFHFVMGEDFDNLLDGAIAAGADLPYACKGGVCSTCRCQVVEGDVEMKLNYSLEEDELAKNYVLSCQAVPLSKKVVIDFGI